MSDTIPAREDFSGRMGPKLSLHSASNPPEWPMYSYERPAWLYFNGVANALRAQGWNDEQIKERLASKDMRWMLDAWEQEVEHLGFAHAERYFGFARKESKP